MNPPYNILLHYGTLLYISVLASPSCLWCGLVGQSAVTKALWSSPCLARRAIRVMGWFGLWMGHTWALCLLYPSISMECAKCCMAKIIWVWVLWNLMQKPRGHLRALGLSSGSQTVCWDTMGCHEASTGVLCDSVTRKHSSIIYMSSWCIYCISRTQELSLKWQFCVLSFPNKKTNFIPNILTTYNMASLFWPFHHRRKSLIW